MAKPELEDGYTQIANEILERLVKQHLSPNQWQVLLCIIRKTYGFHKKVDRIANFQIGEATGLCKEVVSRCLGALNNMDLITRRGRWVGLQKDWERWPKLAEQSTSEKLAVQSTEVSSTANKKLAKQLTTKEKKNTIQKKIYIVIFEFWNSLGIIHHRKLTEDIKRAINAALRSYSQEELCQAMKNYAEVLKGDEYYWTYKWTLKDFLRRGLEKFLDIQTARQNYRREKGGERDATNRGSDRRLPTTYKSPEQHREDYKQKVGS